MLLLVENLKSSVRTPGVALWSLPSWGVALSGAVRAPIFKNNVHYGRFNMAEIMLRPLSSGKAPPQDRRTESAEGDRACWNGGQNEYLLYRQGRWTCEPN